MQQRHETYRGFVYPWTADHLGHMNVQFYVGRFDEASWHFLAQLGLPPRLLEKQRRSFVAAEQHPCHRQTRLPCKYARRAARASR
jgi:acyl-CoA thioester hydrolase